MRPPPARLPRGVAGLLYGASFPLRGASLLARRSRLWRYALVPVLVHLLVFALLAVAAFLLYDDLEAWLSARAVGPAGAGPLAELGRAAGDLAVAVAALLMIVAGVVAGTLLVAAVLAGPFNERLSEAVEELVGGARPRDEPLSLAALSRGAAGAVGAALQRLAIFAVIYLPLAVVSLIPAIGLVAVAGIGLYGSFFLALNFLDPALDRHGLTLGDKLRWARSIGAVHMGFGLTLFAISLLPIVNLLAAPAFVVAGTLLWVEARRRAAAAGEAP